MVFFKKREEVEIPADAASINGALASDNVSLVFAKCEGGRHLVLGGVQQEQDGVYVDTTYGRKCVQSVTVLGSQDIVCH